jgi:hypothetical protein
MMQEWTEKMRQHWNCHWLRSGDDVAEASAVEDMRTAFGTPPSNDEVCRAILYLSGPKVRQEKCPTLRELIRAVAILRKQDRDAAQPPDADGCTACAGSGWVDVAPDMPPRGFALDEYMTAYHCAAPCTCAKGRDCLARCKPYAGMQDVEALDRVLALGALGAQQRVACRMGDFA